MTKIIYMKGTVDYLIQIGLTKDIEALFIDAEIKETKKNNKYLLLK